MFPVERMCIRGLGTHGGARRILSSARHTPYVRRRTGSRKHTGIMTPAAQALQHWLLTDGRLVRSMEELLDQFTVQLRKHVPVDRIWAGTKVLHPQTAAWLWIWEHGKPIFCRELSYTLFAELRQDDTPVRRLELGAPYVRLQAGGDNIPPDSVSLFEERGYTDLFGLSFTLRGTWAGAVTWATQAPDGFSEAHIELFRAIMPAMSASMEPLAAHLVRGALLRTYLGRDPGNRVHQGAVKRGDGTTQRAVLWFSDIRGFVRLSSALDRDDLLELLNDTFEISVDALEPRGGEVLKFLGDGLLAMFPVADTDPTGRKACEAAYDAFVDFSDRLGQLAATRAARGLMTADVTVGLHFGDVSYGNIGAPNRLDFTVIGPAVNLASRVESLCGSVNETILVTETFAQHHGGAWASRGSHQLKGIDDPVVVYSPAAEATD